MQASRPLRPHSQFSEVFRINTPAPVVWHDLQASKVESIPISVNFLIRWFPRVGGKSWTSSQKSSNQRHNATPRQLLGEKRTREEVSFLEGSNGFFQNCWWIAHPEKLANVPRKIMIGKSWFFLFFYLAPFLRGHSFVFGGCKITFTCPCAGDFRVVASRWVNPLHIWSFGDGFITVKP